MAQEHMLRRVREKFTHLLNDYLPVPPVEEYIVTPAVAGNGSATLGNFALAKKVAERFDWELDGFYQMTYSSESSVDVPS